MDVSRLGRICVEPQMADEDSLWVFSLNFVSPAILLVTAQYHALGRGLVPACAMNQHAVLLSHTNGVVRILERRIRLITRLTSLHSVG